MQQKTGRGGVHGPGSVLRRAAALGVAALATAALALPTSAFALRLDKQATDLTDDRTDVTLSLGATQGQTVSDVVFVLDKSTSVEVREAAKAMLDELMDRAGENRIKVGVVVFNKTASEQLPLTDLNSDSFTVIAGALGKTPESGTNIEAGIRAGKEMLDSDTSVDASDKHLVLVTDGVSYLYGIDDTPQTIYTESASNGEESLNAGNDLSSFVNELSSSKAWYDEYGKRIAADIADYSHDYTAGQFHADIQGQQQDSTYKEAGFAEGDYVPGEVSKDHASSNEAAVYSAMNAWKDVVASGYQAYAYASDRYQDTYPWAAAFVSTLEEFGGTSEMVPDDTTGMFDNVKSKILYEFASGTVTDVIGNDFDLTDAGAITADTFTLTVAGQNVAGVVDAENPNKVNFDNGDYSVEYQVSGDTETLVWSINKPVESAAGVTLSYNLTLVNKSTEPGDHTVKTNEKATVTYKPTTGGDVTETFPVPQVTYNVPEPTPEPAQDVLRFEPNAEGATGATPSVTDDEYATVTVSENGFALDGYEFAGWNTAADGSGTAYAPGDPYTLTDADDVLYAQWKKVEEPTKPVEEKPADTTEQKDGDSTLPSTGDIAGMTAGAVAFAGAAAAGIGATLKRRR